MSRNCADFAKDIINFYYPKALHRSVIADVGITTPKQMAKTLTRFSDHHPDLELSRMIIPQVPGSMPRSAAVHGVVESFFKSGKYIVTSAVISPIFAGCVAAVYVGTGAGGFRPARNADVFVVGGNLEPPLDREDRRAYQQQLKHLLAGAYPEASGRRVDRMWGKLQSHAKIDLDEKGRPILEMQVGEQTVRIGDSAENILSGTAPPELVRQLLEARLQSELGRASAKGVTETEVTRDWKLLQQTLPSAGSGHDSETPGRVGSHADTGRGDRP